MKRKVLAFLLSILMVMGSTAAILATTVFADYSSSIVISADNVEVAEDATTATVPILVTGVTDDDDVGAFDIRIGYDAEKLKITKIDTKKCGIKAFASSQFSPYNPVTNPFVILAWDTSEENLLLDSDAEINDMDFCVVNFAILGDWTGTTTLTVTATARNRADNGTITVSTSNGSVKRGEEAEHTHSYTQEVVSNDYLVSAATCISPAVYHKSCTCGEEGTETFTSGEVDSTNHVNTTDVEAQASTCITHGHAAYTICNDCHTVISGDNTDLPYGDHNTDNVAWSHDGSYHWKVCSVCNSEVDKVGHTGGTATCTDAAVCEVCGQSYGAVDSTNHSSISEDWSSDATQHWHACGCGNKIDAADHDFVKTVADEYQKSAATCSSAAVYYKHCSVCGALSEETFTDGEPDASQHVGGTATCVAKAVCTECGQEYGDYDESNHDGFTHEVVGEQYFVSAATCVSPALYYKSCACGAAGTETFTSGEVDSTNHSSISEDWSSDATQHWHACGCGNKIDAADHDFAKIVAEEHFVSAANCQSPAVYKKSCSVCGAESEETFTSGDVDANNHLHVGEDWEKDELEHWHRCEDCGQIDQSTRDEHSFGDWELLESGDYTFRTRTCSVCGWIDSELVVEIVAGNGSSYQQGGESGASFSVQEGYQIVAVVIDGEEIDPENYEVSDDGTTVTLDPDFLETLEPGDHEVEIYVENPDIEVITVAPGTFTVEEVEEEAESEAGAKEPSKALGDESQIFIWTVAMVLSLAGIAFIVTSRKKQGTIR